METIQTITKGKYTLTHSSYIDDNGIIKNSFDLFDNETRKHYPFIGKIRPISSSDIINDNTSQYTDEEYKEMLDEQISNL
jgi:hypothetical protein